MQAQPEAQQVAPWNRGGRLGVLFASVWVVALLVPVDSALRNRDRTWGWIAVACCVLLGTGYTVLTIRLRRERLDGGLAERRPAVGIPILLALVGLTAAAVPGAGADALTCGYFIAVLAILMLPTPWGLGCLLLVAAAGQALLLWVPSVDGRNNGFAIEVLVVGFVMWTIKRVLMHNAALIKAREEIARLAVEAERNRFAQDLHDVLGHSLTVIAMKSELVGRLLEADPRQAAEHVRDIERLSRGALADVRSTVSGYRQLSLSGELANARSVLVASGLEATVSSCAEEVPIERRELFARVVREGTTNVIRHAQARRCEVQVGPDFVQVADDGPARSYPGMLMHEPGSGLTGLARLAAENGAQLESGRGPSGGFVLRVQSSS